MKYDIPSQRRWEDPPQRIGEPDLGILPSGVLRLIDTRFGSRNSRYVKWFVRAFRCGITAARSSCSKLRTPSATMNRVPVPKWDKRHDTIVPASAKLPSG